MSAADRLSELRENATAAAEELEAAQREYREREQSLEEAQEQLVGTLHELQQAETRLTELREPIGAIANAAYQQTDLGGVAGILTSSESEEDLRLAADFQKLSENQQAMIEEAAELQERQRELAGEAQELQASTQLERVEVDSQVDALREQSEASTDELLAELEERGLSSERYMPYTNDSCDPGLAAEADQYPNGLIPSEYLCELHEEGELLRPDAAAAFIELNNEYLDHFGETICITDAYRPLSEQQSVFYSRPGFAAVPGTSNHGLGMALDLCGGIQNFRSEQFNWLEEHGQRYGWIHPDWAKSNPFEPWHWEFVPEQADY
ncbi:D-alanyl-D-alanine carboxypeptidase family protein [Allonocardiopsis opalescens]|uniref:D-alanyl-D-alanine carboxypeptidase family protein n=1 Tax=Allonocardiopsis opalescens TaxID=1144618 RepID=UPI001FE4551D|nr:D-alanyl-D-alanine carboxypeptidase family protein [Allonocardiopsis opalescens]